MPDVDYTGQHGGLLAMAFAAGCVATSAFWMTVAGFIWKMFIEKRVNALETQVKAEQHECELRVQGLKDRIVQLETMLMLHGPQALRQAMQAAVSETHLEIRQLQKDKADEAKGND